jgi:hypothetical protein
VQYSCNATCVFRENTLIYSIENLLNPTLFSHFKKESRSVENGYRAIIKPCSHLIEFIYFYLSLSNTAKESNGCTNSIVRRERLAVVRAQSISLRNVDAVIMLVNELARH